MAAMAHLSGSRRGITEYFSGDRLRLGKGDDVEIRVSAETAVAEHHATLCRDGESYRIDAVDGRDLWINGSAVSSATLRSGDLVEVGQDGPVLRFRLYAGSGTPGKSLRQALSDSVDGARYGARDPLSKAALLLRGILRELTTQTSMRSRLVLVLLLLLMVSTGYLLHRSLDLERQLATEASRFEGLAELLQDNGGSQPRSVDLEAMRQGLSAALDRVEALEARSGAPGKVVATAAPSVALLLGSYGFSDPTTGKVLRFAAGDLAQQRRGEPRVGLDATGPRVEIQFTGTAFVVSMDGLWVTNRHVALPWEFDAAARLALARGLEAEMIRFQAYLPGHREPFSMAYVTAAEKADLALLMAPQEAWAVTPLPLSTTLPRPGSEILVLGYPAGIQALLARAERQLVDQVVSSEDADLWQVARQLGEAQAISPLASRGIVAQISAVALVYDAETTRGGSGGPVLDLEGRVVAVTSAVLTDFGGSNLGVPAKEVGQLLLLGRAAGWRPFPLR